MGMEGNGNVYMGNKWKWEETFGWHGNGMVMNGKAEGDSRTPLLPSISSSTTWIRFL